MIYFLGFAQNPTSEALRVLSTSLDEHGIALISTLSFLRETIESRDGTCLLSHGTQTLEIEAD